MIKTLRVVAALAIAASAACKDKGPTGPPPGTGIPTKVVEVGATSRSAFANGVVGGTITVAVQDTFSKPVAGQIVQFSVVLGGGSLVGNLVDTTDASGQATAPAWRLGKSANGPNMQTLRAISGPLNPLDINATVLTSYNIVVRFFDAASMTPAQQGLFTAAAQRIMGIVTSDVSDVQFTNQDISTSCNVPGQAPLTEIVDDIVIYATISNIDGPGQILASAGPCFIRTGATNNKIPVMGVMKFDINDIGTLSGNGSLQEVITHEMMHVLGLGSLWGSSYFNFVNGSGTADPQYNAPAAKAACQGVGGVGTCANGVPLEGPPAGPGTRESHWRESSLTNELMTGFINTSPNPLSSITIGGLQDMGYTVNAADNDSYNLASIMASMLRAPGGSVAPSLPPNWERLNNVPLYGIDASGNVRLLRKAQ